MRDQGIVFGTVTSKGQVVIPARLRRELGIKAGTRVAFQQSDGHLIVQPVNASAAIKKWSGMFRDNGEALRYYKREHRKDKW